MNLDMTAVAWVIIIVMVIVNGGWVYYSKRKPRKTSKPVSSNERME